MTLHLPFPSMSKSRYKSSFSKESYGPRSLKKLGLPMSVCLSVFLSLSYSLLQSDPLEHRGSLNSLICLGFYIHVFKPYILGGDTTQRAVDSPRFPWLPTRGPELGHTGCQSNTHISQQRWKIEEKQNPQRK